MSLGVGNKKERLKNLIKELHKGVDPEKVKEKFREVLEEIGPTDIARVEEELIKEGLPREEIRRLCDIHLAVLKASLEKEKAEVPPGHPVQTFMEEHKMILGFLEELKRVAQRLSVKKSFTSAREELEALKQVANCLTDVESHYTREENVLFPYLEKHGIREPPAVMWSEHQELKAKKKQLLELTESPERLKYGEFVKKVRELADYIADGLSSHIYKEDNILYPAALGVVTDGEWRSIKAQCDEIGYRFPIPRYEWPSTEQKAAEIPPAQEGVITFETGSLTQKEVDAILNTLPFDITFVDKDDTVRYFSQGRERIFPRTKAVIGRKVQQCHPQKSIHVVNKILEDFKTRCKDSAIFWIDMKDRKIYIRYFPVWSREGEYLGCVEVTQDITEIQKITGEKRLL